LKQRKTLYEWMTTKYLFIIRNEDNYDEKANLVANPAKIIFFAACLIAFITTLGFYFGKMVYNRPIYNTVTEAQLAKKIQQLAYVLDSLEQKINANYHYANVAKNVLGEQTKYLKDEIDVFKIDSLTKARASRKNTTTDTIDLDYLDAIDLKLRKEIEGNLTGKSNKETEKKSQNNTTLVFGIPLEGTPEGNYEPKSRFLTLVAVQPEASVYATAAGTMVAIQATEKEGLLMVVQHNNEYLSFYKNCAAASKAIGEKVKAGEIIGKLGKNEKKLYFSITQAGNAVNPEQLIKLK